MLESSLRRHALFIAVLTAGSPLVGSGAARAQNHPGTRLIVGREADFQLSANGTSGTVAGEFSVKPWRAAATAKSDERYDSPFQKQFDGYAVKPVAFVHVLKFLLAASAVSMLVIVVLLIRRRQRRVRRDTKLAASEARHRSLLSSMSEGVVMQDSSGRIVAFNDRASQILDLSEDQLLGRDSMDSRWGAIHEDGTPFPGLEHPPMGALRTRQSVRGVIMGINRSDGGRSWLEINSNPVITAGTERPSSVVSSFSDVSERLRTQAALAQSKNLLHAIVESVPAMIAYWDRDVRCVFANRAYSRWVRIDHDTIQGMHARDILGDELYRVSEPFMQGALRGDTQVFERVHHDPDGNVLHVAVTYVPDMTGDEVKGFFILLTDTTELTRLVEDRTRDLTQARDEARAANRAKDEFLANVPHEMPTPLHAIRAFTELGLLRAENMADAKLAKYLRNTDDAARCLGRFVEQLLALAKSQAGHTVICIASVDLKTQIEANHAMVEQFLAAKNLTFKVDLQTADSVIDADPHLVDQVITNLLSNAIKFSPREGVITATLTDDQVTSADGSTVCALRLSVSDQGVGIPDDELGSIFNKFVQRSRTRTGAGGTGLGLSVCREIMVSHGGCIRARNNAAGGACFDAIFPREAQVELGRAA